MPCLPSGVFLRRYFVVSFSLVVHLCSLLLLMNSRCSICDQMWERFHHLGSSRRCVIYVGYIFMILFHGIGFNDFDVGVYPELLRVRLCAPVPP